MKNSKLVVLIFRLVLALGIVVITWPAQAAVPCTLNYDGKTVEGVLMVGAMPYSVFEQKLRELSVK